MRTMNNMAKASFMHNLEDLRDDLDELREVVSELFNSSQSDTKVAKRRVGRGANKTLKHLENTYQDVKLETAEALGKVQHHITERPVLSAIGSFAAGLAVGRLMAKSKR